MFEIGKQGWSWSEKNSETGLFQQIPLGKYEMKKNAEISGNEGKCGNDTVIFFKAEMFWSEEKKLNPAEHNPLWLKYKKKIILFKFESNRIWIFFLEFQKEPRIFFTVSPFTEKNMTISKILGLE